MASPQDEDMYLFHGGFDTDPTHLAGGDFDAVFDTGIAPEQDVPTHGYLNPVDLIKRESSTDGPAANSLQFTQSHRGSASSSSSSEDSQYHDRNNSEASASSSALAGTQGAWSSGINGLPMPAHSQLYQDSPMTGMDVEASNKAMNDAFDFDTAASTPSGYDAAAMNNTNSQMKRVTNFAGFGQQQSTAPRPQNGPKPGFYFPNSREVSPLNAMLPGAQNQSPWNKPSPSVGLEETFHNMGVNGDSPGQTTFSPNFSYPGHPYFFEPESSATPSSFTKDVSSPPSTVSSADAPPKLTVHPTSHKSRVETQIPIKLTMSHLPPGAKKLRLPAHTVSKPKFLAKGDVERTPEVLELYTALVCTSAMQDRAKFERAMARARGEELAPPARPSPPSSATSQSSQLDEDKPLNGGEVKICVGCMQRERKRASRKKQKKPEEEELFQKDEEKRVVVFNTNEIKEWSEIPKDSPASAANRAATPAPGPNAMQVELPMRIACYCRHQNEKMGFQVIFTVKDHRDKLVAQSITNSIMITDDHKTHNAAPVQPLPGALPGNSQFPGSGVFQSAAMDSAPGPAANPKIFKQSFSTNDLKGLQHTANAGFRPASGTNPFAIPAGVSNETSSTMTPRNLSRPASPSGPTGPSTKKRKQSGSGKLPHGLTMTRLDTAPAGSGSMTQPNSAVSSPFAPNLNAFVQQPMDRAFAGVAQRPHLVNTSPPTPNGNEAIFHPNINRSFSLENLPRQAIISAPPSRQPSRPGSPALGSARNSFGAQDSNFSQAVSNQLMGQPTRRPPPLIHKLVPGEGSVTGGTEVTLLGNGFYQGLEVMFGDTEATTTTFWGEKCLNCIAPPALSPGTVPVLFKHEHPQYSAMQQHPQPRSVVFTYIDDRELEMFRLALRTIGKQMQRPTDDPYSAAQQLIQGQQQSIWGTHGSYGMGHQRAAGYSGAPMDPLELEDTMVYLLEYIDLRAPTALKRLDLRRPSGMTLLHLAASLGLTRFAAGLLGRGADPNLTDNNGHTPMHHAAMNGHTHIIHRLRLAGGSHKARSIRNFIPADLATSLLAYQAAVTPTSHYRSRSVGGTPMRLQSRRNSSTSLSSFWENQSLNYVDSSSDEEEETITMETNSPVELAKMPKEIPRSRRGSSQQLKVLNIPAPAAAIQDGPNGSPSAFMLAWRDHLVHQVQQFNESAQSVMPSLATLNGPLQALQEYQAYPVVRRVSRLLPQRPSSRPNGTAPKEGWWETLTGQSSPSPPPAAELPAYDELYPDEGPSSEDTSMKKQSAMQAAADAIADSHFEAQPSSQAGGDSRTALPKKVMVNGRQIQRVELRKDWKLFFIWIPVLALVMALMIRSSGLLELMSGISKPAVDNIATESPLDKIKIPNVMDEVVGQQPAPQDVR